MQICIDCDSALQPGVCQPSGLPAGARIGTRPGLIACRHVVARVCQDSAHGNVLLAPLSQSWCFVSSAPQSVRPGLGALLWKLSELEVVYAALQHNPMLLSVALKVPEVCR